MSQLRVTVWNEGIHESTKDPAGMPEYYPNGIHGAIATGIGEHLPDATVRTALLSYPEHGLTETVLEATDVLLWWGHKAHAQVDDEVVEQVRRHVLGGMGLLVLHSGHFSKIFTRLLGTTCSLSWRNAAEREVLWTVDPTHPIADGIPNPVVIPEQETYGEFFDIPTPDELVFISSFTGGEVFRSGATFRRGRGRIFYFSPGDERYPVYNQPEIQRILANGIRWVAQPGLPRTIPTVSNPSRDWFRTQD
ncbi:ThuA domain-containing protein [Saccharopolyspora phatthalungensis]|uniref:Trehalose utilization protein n=1 Tax=Saccharopolyspora phatthalungensis TaxID=664693 RepID=A0A840QD19_9PSEU|nr:ThuA domain-containing protein [Saccharopolyspora phatthalungensis]MBB5157680.1 trehalose utilization protein [Saccharopolyspora phatthalungensis]